MTISVAGRTVSLGAALAAVGALVAIIGSVLPWLTATYGGGLKAVAESSGTATSATGLEGNGGKIIVVVGLVLIAVVVAGVLNIKLPMISIGILGLAVIILGIGLINLVARMDDVKKFTDMIATVKDYVDTSGTSASVGIGMYLAVLGGVVAVVGGALDLVKKPAA
jgi:hypothetical protein